MVAIYTKINWSKNVCVLGVVQSYACPDDWLAECSQKFTGGAHRSPGRQAGTQRSDRSSPLVAACHAHCPLPGKGDPWHAHCTTTKPRPKIKIQGHFDFDPFAQIMWGGTRIMIYITCYSSKRKGLNRKMGIWYSIQIPIYFAEKDRVHSLYTVHVQNNRSRGKMGGNFKPMFI